MAPDSSLVARTYVPSPWRHSSSPAWVSARTASRTVLRPTPSCSASTVSVGILPFIGHVPVVICSLSWSITWSTSEARCAVRRLTVRLLWGTQSSYDSMTGFPSVFQTRNARAWNPPSRLAGDGGVDRETGHDGPHAGGLQGLAVGGGLLRAVAGPAEQVAQLAPALGGRPVGAVRLTGRALQHDAGGGEVVGRVGLAHHGHRGPHEVCLGRDAAAAEQPQRLAGEVTGPLGLAGAQHDPRQRDEGLAPLLVAARRRERAGGVAREPLGLGRRSPLQ